MAQRVQNPFGWDEEDHDLEAFGIALNLDGQEVGVCICMYLCAFVCVYVFVGVVVYGCGRYDVCMCLSFQQPPYIHPTNINPAPPRE